MKQQGISVQNCWEETLLCFIKATLLACLSTTTCTRHSTQRTQVTYLMDSPVERWSLWDSPVQLPTFRELEFLVALHYSGRCNLAGQILLQGAGVGSCYSYPALPAGGWEKLNTGLDADEKPELSLSFIQYQVDMLTSVCHSLPSLLSPQVRSS